jgi:hypothetical protein
MRAGAVFGMARKKKTISATKLVKELARETVGTPPPSRVLPDRRADVTRKTEKHKKRAVEQSQAE